MHLNPKQRIAEIDHRLQELPKGTLTYKKINGKSQPYVQRTVEGKSVSYYVKLSEREQVFLEFQERSELLGEKGHLLAYVESLKKILKSLHTIDNQHDEKITENEELNIISNDVDENEE